MDDARTRRLLERLATAAGIALFPLSGLAGSARDTAARDTACIGDAVEEDACPPAATAARRFDYGGAWYGTVPYCWVDAVLGEPSRDGDTCCYEVAMTCWPADTGDTGGKDGSSSDNGCMGRPYVAGGRPVLATLRPRPAAWPWPTPDIQGLNPDRRAVLAELWARIALAEHASIAEFHRIALELLRFGAPGDLLGRAQLAAVDEGRHAGRCFAVASAYAGRPLEAGVLPLPASVELADTLPALVERTIRDGCIAETCSVSLYDGLRERASDPVVRAVIQGVVRDETRHAALAWATVRWALSVGGPEARRAAEVAWSEAPSPFHTHTEVDDPLLAAHAWAPSRVQARLIAEARARVVRPLAEGLGFVA